MRLVFQSLSDAPAVNATSPLSLTAAPGLPRRLIHLCIQLAATEFLAIGVAAYSSSVLYNWMVLERWPPASQYLPAALFISAAALLTAIAFHHYSAVDTQPRHRFMWSGIGSVALAFSLFLSGMFLLKIAEGYSRGTFLIQFFAVIIVVLTVRAATYSRLHSAIAAGMVEARRAVLIGDMSHAREIADQLKGTGIHTVGSFEFPLEHGSENAAASVQPTYNPRTLVDACRALRPDDIVIVATPERFAEITTLTSVLSELPAAIHVVPSGALKLLTSSRPGELGSIGTIQVLHPPLSDLEHFAKRGLDVLVASLGIVVLAPVFLVVSLAIKLDSRGPILFRQTRHGYNNQPIQVLKFRSMNVMEDGQNFIQAVRDDARVTPFGRVLRSTNIDELPQLFNVLRGDMSIVGPRPHPVALNLWFKEHIWPYSKRHNVKPGITGWAQVNGHRGETDTVEKMQMRLEYDIYYIDNWSLYFDIKIILLTLLSRRAYTNAY
jgi:Undecaprenyl-phosphate glucose phosphotransferase